jgi:lysophospholipase L1-like esterase
MQNATLQLEKGKTATDFEPYSKTIKKEYLRSDYTWYGKKAIFNGDSILELPYNWGKQMCKELGIVYKENKAIGGSTLAEWGNTGTAPKDRTPLISRYNQMTTDADIVFISIGTNDWAYTWANIGTDSDTVNTTFKGCLHSMIKDMLDIYIGKVIVFVTPIKRNTPNDKNGFDKTLEDYANAIIDVCGQYGIPVLDMFHNCPLNPSIATQQAEFFDGSKNATEGYTNLYNDTTHPNYYGAKIQARCAIGFMNSLYIF